MLVETNGYQLTSWVTNLQLGFITRMRRVQTITEYFILLTKTDFIFLPKYLYKILHIDKKKSYIK